MGSYIISLRSNGEYQFVLKADNGERILASEGYTNKAACMNGVESVRKNSQEDSRYDRRISSNNKKYFNLKAVNGQVIGTSEMYESDAGMENGIASVKKNALAAMVKDQA